MTDDRGTLRRIAWRDLLPWLIIFRTFSLSLSLPLLLLATAGVLLQPIGWRIADLFIDSETLAERPAFAAVAQSLHSWPGRDSIVLVADERLTQDLLSSTSLRSLTPEGRGDYAGIWDRTTYPFRALFSRELTLNMFAYFLFGGLWTLAIWSIIGGAITRVAVVYLGLEERVSIRDALRYAGRRYGSYFVAPLYPLLGVVLLIVPLALLGLLMRIDFGVVVAGILWFLVLIASLGITLLAVGLLFGWPLMWPVISAENGDAFEALSRSFGYTFQRPFHYLFFALVATLFAGICWLLVSLFAGTVVDLAEWGVTWGASDRRFDVIEAAGVGSPREGQSDMLRLGASLIRFWETIVYGVAYGFAYSLFFSLASAIYLLLRHVDDETELDEVFMDDDEERFTLPTVSRDAAGVPTMKRDAESPSATPAPPSDKPLSEEE